MCSDENGAPHAVRYLNSQLAALHQNAQKCLAEHPQAISEENKHFYALAEFAVLRPGVTSQVPSASNALFHARFKAPTLEFICDHDVLLHLTIDEGHFVDSSKGPSTKRQVTSFIPYCRILDPPTTLPAGLRITFRAGFEMREIYGNDLRIGEYSSVIDLVVLGLRGGILSISVEDMLTEVCNPADAIVLSVSPALETGRETLIRYLGQYLEFLQEAGNHVLFSLPQFNQHSAPMEIDYSLASRPGEQHWQESIYDVSVDQINAYLSSLWLKSTMLAQGSILQEDCDWRLRCLTELVHKESGFYYRLRFGAPRVNILCSKEVVVYFDIDELEFFDNEELAGEAIKTFKKWQIAMVMNVMPARDAAGYSITITLDLANARYHHMLSSYCGLNHDEARSDQYCSTVVNFFVEDYLQILHEARYHIIYSHDSRWEMVGKPKPDAGDESEGSWWTIGLGEGGSAASQETIQRTKMYGFDQVVAVSQGSINVQFSAASYAIFRTWEFEQSFSATFKPLALHLLSDNRALIWVHITSGKLKTLKNGAPCTEESLHEFQNWRLAFEVGLKMCAQEELENSSSPIYKATPAYQKHGTQPDRVLKHIYLDLKNAIYIHDYSSYAGFQTVTAPADGRTLVCKMEAVIWYLTRQYFPALCKDGLNVVFTVPVWQSGASLPSYALTDVTFHVYSRVEVTRYNWAQVSANMEPIVVVLGTTGGKPLPSQRLEFSTNWIVQANKGFSHGTISIAQRVFIEQRLLQLLANVNAQTTLIPVLFNPLLGFHGVNMKRWAEHDQRKDRPSKWRLVPSEGADCLRYLWEHCEEWQYKLSGNGELDAAQGIYCITRNCVELPTTVKEGALHIKVSGRIDLRLSFQTATTKLTQASSSVYWSANVSIQTIGSSIKVSTLGSLDPTFTEAEYTEGSTTKFRNPKDMLRGAFPEKINLDDLVQEIHAFEGAWEYFYPLATPYSLASPVFNDDGDLLFELRRHNSGPPRLPPMAPGGRFGRPGSPIRPQSRAGRGGRASPAPSAHPFSSGSGQVAFGESVKIVVTGEVVGGGLKAPVPIRTNF
ncbi:hypothetical protein C8Q73DRAFT_782384 [Cubamyces lactineus]|nr:hypothetical protein C8Q73DRAFT_782384 [Cubamyces lactineus]